MAEAQGSACGRHLGPSLPDKAVPGVILGWLRISVRGVDKLALKLARVPILTRLESPCFPRYSRPCPHEHLRCQSHVRGEGLTCTVLCRSTPRVCMMPSTCSS